ncbi:MAG: COX15/CtaA family protein [Bradyrhizobiaceae bacterium]|nr:COX15/CtaA family protein [Bradyrhizobiaceae bacterium]
MSQISLTRDPMRPVRTWLWCVAALVAVTVIVGGATRLTGSGLSITEWRPVTGIIPPLTTADWLLEFDKYRQIPQFLVLNPDMTLGGFQFIYWWEWSHRMLGRLIGLAFIVPFGIFWARGVIDRALAWKLGGLFVLGGIQGTIGWWMVASGLAERTDVSQYRLAIHLTVACIILSAIVAVAVSLRGRTPDMVLRRTRAIAIAVLVLVFVQIFLGALVAKTSAGLTFNTWPLMDGRIIPPFEQLLPMQPLWTNFFENVMTVQFTHRMVAYLLFAVALIHALDLHRTGPVPAAQRAITLFALVTGQAALGVITLLWISPLWLSLLHQAGAVLVLVAATSHVTQMSAQAAKP